ncbi:response regulator [Paenibacillus nasutitermitis]|uniref:Two-component system, response regulator YesN n=1 Tax=Paenibacillus nasutitermitis TaxID=1652958 RepID=A0A916YSR7_9BACL|nr:response regulator [Paenibacillus nasutitermitis]GGD59911.1 hypothetical protein GCM10010911_17210 [Paenibacillus nasutitermitis]
MYRLLIVDDEELFVNGLAEMLVQEVGLNEVEICRAYSAEEALEWFKQTKIDILMTDIQMPRINGLELQKRIHSYWPRCKVVFLTGYDNFSYAQEAIRSGGADYLLKTEGDDTVLAVVHKVIAQLHEEDRAEQLRNRAESMIRKANEALKQECLIDLISGVSNPDSLDCQFKELNIRLNGSSPIMLVAGTVDQWKEGATLRDRSIYLFAIRNVADEKLQFRFLTESVHVDRSRLIWFIQQKDEEEITSRYVQGVLESVQTTCRELFGVKLSFAVASKLVSWALLDQQVERLQLQLLRHVGFEQERLLIEDEPAGEPEAGKTALPARRIRKDIEMLQFHLEHNQQETFREALIAVMMVPESEENAESLTRLEIHSGLTAMFISYLRQWALRGSVEKQVDLSRLFRYDHMMSWHDTCLYFTELSEQIFHHRYHDWQRHGSDLVTMLHKYIGRNIGGDLSLTQLGRIANHNPAYLSRLYKQLTERGLSEVIAERRLEKAQELLRDPAFKIHEIARSIGFESMKYFRKFFRGLTGMSPQEYREWNKEVDVEPLK